MEQSNENVSKHEIAATKKRGGRATKIILIVLAIIMLVGIGIGILIWREFSEYNRNESEDTNMVFATTLNLVELTGSSDKPAFETIAQLPFGTEVTILGEDSIDYNDKRYYPCSYYIMDDGRRYKCKGDTYLEVPDSRGLYDGYYGEIIRDMFPLKETRELPLALRWCLVNYLEANDYMQYRFTQDRNRISSSIVHADLNMDGEEDYAVVMQDEAGLSYNRIVVMCYNPDISEYYVAFSDLNYALAELNLFDSGASIFIDSEGLLSAPNVGIMYTNQNLTTGEVSDDNKYAIFYDPQTKMFRICRQVSISSYDEEAYADDEYSEDEYEEYSEDDEYYESAIIEADPIVADTVVEAAY